MVKHPLCFVTCAGIFLVAACSRTAPPPILTSPATEATATPSPPPRVTRTPTPTEPPASATPTSDLSGPAIPHLAPGREVTITQVSMLTAGVGWGIGSVEAGTDHILRTADGGSTWQDVTPPELAGTSGAPPKRATVSFLTSDQAWVVYLEPAGTKDLPRAWGTQDGGETWTQGGELPFEVEPIAGQAETELLFIDASHGWILERVFAGMGHEHVELLGTSDGGQSWESKLVLADTGCFRTGFDFANPEFGWMTGDCHGVEPGPALEKSEDSGATWGPQPVPEPAADPGLFERSYCAGSSPRLFSAQEGVFLLTCFDLGDPSQSSSYVYTTRDGGASWQASEFPGGRLHWLNPNTGWALSEEIYFTQNAGRTWAHVKTVNWSGEFSFVSADLGWAVARSEGEVALVQTQDGGRTWRILEPVIGP